MLTWLVWILAAVLAAVGVSEIARGDVGSGIALVLIGPALGVIATFYFAEPHEWDHHGRRHRRGH